MTFESMSIKSYSMIERQLMQGLINLLDSSMRLAVVAVL